jgi:2,3-bisphosphoglycerate-independent phosphoglycerate mutase
MNQQQLLARLARPSDSRIVLLVLDGVGDLRSDEQPATALEVAATPNLDELARRSATGRLIPVAPGITPGSGPGHLALFGYDPTEPAGDIGRGVLEAMGLGIQVLPGQVAVRCNFATADASGHLTDRRAGRIPTSECLRLCEVLSQALREANAPAEVTAGEAHRFVLVLDGEALSDEVADTDPQAIGVPPLEARATAPAGEATAALANRVIGLMEEAIRDEPRANRVLARGFSNRPDLPSLSELHQARFGAFAGYPLYRGVAAACGMEIVPCGKTLDEILDAVVEAWHRFDFFFLHVKQTDQAGEDGSLTAKAEVLEQVDRALPKLIDLGPEVIAVTADHSTPAPLAAHSWHPVPLLVHSDRCFVDNVSRFDEEAVTAGHLGTLRSTELMPMLLANAGKLAKFGA